MSSTLAVSIVAPHTSRAGRRNIARIALAVIGAVGILTTTNQAAGAQELPAQRPRWDLLLTSGTVVPTGAQREAIKRANLSAAQLSYAVHPALAVTGMFGWARSRDIASAGDPKLDVFTYDLGAEVRAPQPIGGRAITLRPFAGVGAGGRSYNYRSLHVDATHNVAAYGNFGGELGFGRVHVRLEARDYVTGFKPLQGGGAADTRNDIALLAGLRITRR